MNGEDGVTGRLVLIRHGRSAMNRRGLLSGRGDVDLDEVGVQQARRAAEILRSGVLGDVRTVVSSPLRRAIQTAEPLGLPVEIDERFTEMDYGSLEGVPLSEVPAETWARWRSDVHFAPPGGESHHQLGERVRAGCEHWLSRSGGDHTVAVFSHVSPVKAAVAWALGADESVVWRTRLDNASLTVIDEREGLPQLRMFNLSVALGFDVDFGTNR